MPTRSTAVLLVALAAVVGLAFLLRQEPAALEPDVGGEVESASISAPAHAGSAPSATESDALATERRAASSASRSRATLRVEVFDHLGAPVGEGFTVTGREAIDYGAAIYTEPAPEPLVAAEVRGGVAEFEVPEATALDLRVAHRDGLVHPGYSSLGPIVAGQTRTVVVRLRPPLGFVVGVLVDADGKPAVDTEISVAVHFAPTEHTTVRTDAMGRFRAGFLPHPGRTRTIDVEVGLGGVRESWSSGERQDLCATPRARAVLSMPFGSGTRDLGTLVLQPVPAFAGGAFVDEAGRPVAGVEVATSILGVFDSGFRGVSSLRATTDADGRFEIREWPPGTPIRLRIEVDDPAWTTTRFECDLRDATGLRLVARPCAAASGSVRFSVVAVQPHVRLVVPGQPDVVVQHRWLDRYSSRVLEWVAKGIAPGPFELELRSGGELLWRSGRLVAVLGQCLRDPGLQDVDLTAR